jgi:hypothetical protein
MRRLRNFLWLASLSLGPDPDSASPIGTIAPRDAIRVLAYGSVQPPATREAALSRHLAVSDGAPLIDTSDVFA